MVTGSSTGLGRGIAVALGRAGARVVVADVAEAATEGHFDEAGELTTAALINSEGGEAFYHACDVSNANAVEATVQAAVSRFGRLDGFVNNAGIYRGGPFHELAAEDLDACLAVIVRGTWFGCQAAIRQFLTQDGAGSIVNIVSTAGLRGHAYQAAYTTAKSAQAGLTRALGVEYAKTGIRVNGVCPTYMKTAMSRSGIENPEFDATIAATIPAGRWGQIADVATSTLFLLSDEADFLRGVLLPVDGGETAGAAPHHAVSEPAA
ncbi:SDR family NAD(P)-dependent oxidoreductase [Sphingopyxis sp. 113P3]|uniref:SDR family NAD(P)-dependent oxidoreductase n=1 Tax=Sphingopyxis sp. (strain 113P3) TaxID=292913 RepID=UPI001F32FBE2|nr:SDR family NAD(P)-dependent oxidoreductase [Sphingopyxis sp. 113P3]